MQCSVRQVEVHLKCSAARIHETVGAGRAVAEYFGPRRTFSADLLSLQNKKDPLQKVGWLED